MAEIKNTPQLEQISEEPLNLYALFFKFFAYWPWFIVSVVGCLLLAFIYLRYQTPIYNISASVLIKEQDARSKAMMGTNGALGALQDIGGFSMTSNFDNEIEILKSRTLIRKVVTDLNLYINTQQQRTFGYAPSLYKQSPVVVSLTPEEAEQLQSTVVLYMRYTPQGSLSVRAEYEWNEAEQVIEKEFPKLPAVLPTDAGVFRFSADSLVLAEMKAEGKALEQDLELITHIAPPTVVATAYANNLSVTPTSKTTTIAKISLQNSSRQRGIDFINRLVAIYNQDANDEKNEVARKSAEFIEERIAIINEELGSTESQLASFKQRSGLTDLTSDAQLALTESSKYEQQRIENATQISLVQFLQNYINDPKNDNEVIPANVGLQDNNLTNVINQYNQLIIERNRLLRTSSENNPAVINLNTGIEAMRTTVRTTVQSVLKGLQIAKADIQRQTSKYESRISAAPEKEKEFMTISRQQEIKATLYTMLLQKREENAITLAATANNGRIVEQAQPSLKPVSPKSSMIALAALILGLCLPVGFVYLRDLLKYKIENREDVERITTVPILAELPKCDTPANSSIVVRENKNDMMEETFRGLRTNMLFMLEPQEKVILFTSTQPGEGKSFLAANTAISLAFLGKKVIILGMDIRKPGLNKAFGFTRSAKGITNYLNDPEHTDLMSLIMESQISPNLQILPGGPVPPNPTELVARPVLDDMINMLKERYDYVILDTAPIGMVTDTAIIGRVADLCVYACRADYTPKNGYEYINVLKNSHKFPKLATVINGIDMRKRKNAYGYGYGKRYGYGYGYGYGYDAENKKKKS